MAIPSTGRHIYTSPKNDVQLRSALFSAAMADVDLQGQVTTLDGEVVKANAAFGTDELIIVSDGVGKDVKASTVAIADIVTADSAFSADNSVLRSDGTNRGIQNSTMSIDDNGVVDIINPATSGTTRILLRLNDGEGQAFRFQTSSTGHLSFQTLGARNLSLQNSASSAAMIMENGGQLWLIGNPIVANESGGDTDFRIEGDTLPYAFFVDASAATENIALVAAAAPNWQSMDRGLFIGNCSTAPTGNPASGVFMYADSGELKVRNTSGTVTQVSGSGSSYTVAGYGAGTNAALSGSSAEVDRGTTDSAITLTQAGTYRIRAGAYFNQINTTFGGGSMELKLRRTNNTAGDLTNSTIEVLPLRFNSTTIGLVANLPEITYTTANTDDRIALFARYTGSAPTGSIEITNDFIFAERIS